MSEGWARELKYIQGQVLGFVQCTRREKGLDGIQILISNFLEVIVNNWREGWFKSCLM